jgi:hypothetical protein
MEHIHKTIEVANERIRQLEAEAIKHKKLVNQLCAFANMEPQYGDADLQTEGVASLTVKRNSFFGRPLSTCVREFLEMRQKATLGPASLDEIFGALKTGGFDLEQISTKSDTDQKRGLSIMLGKNSQTFIRLPNDDWGLQEWYPDYKDKKRKKAEANKENGGACAADGKGEGTGEGEGNSTAGNAPGRTAADNEESEGSSVA